MISLVLVSNGRLVIEERDPGPRPGPDWVLIRVAAAGVCGSDLPRLFDGGAYHYPLVPGHEFAGTVVEPVAARPSGSAPAVRVGDRVAVFPLIPNPEEAINEIGEYALSERYDYFGSRRDGALQEQLWVPGANLFPVRDDLSLLHAALAEPCAVACHAAGRPRVEAGMSAAVIGAGPIGIMTAQWLRMRGCDPVCVSDVDPRKRDTAGALGLTPVDAAADPVAAIREATAGGADVVVEACGLPVTMRQALESAGLFGQVVALGNMHGEFRLPEREYSSMLRRELTVYGSWNSKVTPRGRDEWTRVLAHLGRGIEVAPLVSHTPALAEGPVVLESMHARSGWFNKVVFAVDPEALA